MCVSIFKLPIADGASLRVFNIFSNMQKDQEIFLCFLPPNSRDIGNIQRISKIGIFKKIYCLSQEENNTHHFYSFFLKTLFGNDLLDRTNPIERAVLQIICKEKIDVLHVIDSHSGIQLANIDFSSKFLDLIDSPSLYAHRMLNFKRFSKNFFRNSIEFFAAKKNEKYLVKKYKMITLVSPVDKNYMRKLYGNIQVQLIPNGTNISEKTFEVINENPVLMFSGNMGYYPNIEAVQFIVNNVLPLIKQTFPKVLFYNAGINPSKEVKKLGRKGNVILTGFVDDMSLYLSKATVILEPIRLGSGQQNKILEALASGKPVVTTKNVADSFSRNVKDCLIIGEGANDIAQKTIKLIKDRTLREELGKKGKKPFKHIHGRTLQIYTQVYTIN